MTNTRKNLLDLERRKTMKKILILSCSFVIAICTLTACNHKRTPSKPDKPTIVATKTDSQNILDILSSDNNNVVLSDFSIKMALSMLMEGASNETLNELESYYDKPISSLSKQNKKLINSYNQLQHTNLNIANSLWYDQLSCHVKDDYISTLKSNYMAEVTPIHFNSSGSNHIINNWCKQKTNNLISKIVDDNALKNMKTILINTLYFKGTWLEPFYENNTKQDIFKNSDGTTSQVNFMHSKESTYLETENATGFMKPYSDGIVFVGILPKDEKVNVEDINIKKIIETKTNIYDVYIKVPKMKLEYGTSLKEAFKKVGIKKVFSDKADLKKISDDDLFISDILHKTHIEVNESGTEAAAATIIEEKTSSSFQAPKEKKEVNLDKPFVFAIYDSVNDEILFSGKITNLQS